MKNQLIDECKALFSSRQRPISFTNDPCCGESAEHEATLQATTPDTIELKDLGTSAWSPLGFMTSDGFKYFFPSFIRLTFEELNQQTLPAGSDFEFFEQFLTEITRDSYQNRRLKTFSETERQFVVRFLQTLSDLYPDLMEYRYNPIALESAIKLWDPDR